MTGFSHCFLLPFGELFISQRNIEAGSEFDSRYKFTAKELDNETNYTYFGARYYDSDVSVWLSVDPMSDRYPWVSPYAYVNNSPVMITDPDGMDWFVDEETGNIQNNKDMGKEDTKALGDNWKWMGENDMFGESPDKLYDDFQNQEHKGGESISFGLDGEQAKKFMDERGYNLEKKSEIVDVTTTDYYYTDADGGERSVCQQKKTNTIPGTVRYTYVDKNKVLSKTNSTFLGRSWRTGFGWRQETMRQKNIYQYGYSHENNFDPYLTQKTFNTFMKGIVQPMLETLINKK